MSTVIHLYFLYCCDAIKNAIKIKSAPTEADAQKTQTPIVAKPIQYKGQLSKYIVEFAFLSNSKCI